MDNFKKDLQIFCLGRRLIMNLEEYIKSTKWIEERQFFQTLSGFETVTNFSNLPFDLSPETNELFKHSFLCHYL